MWFHLTDKATGARTTVASLSGYDAGLFTIVELEREPTEFEDVIDGKLVRNLDREANTKAGPAHIAASHLRKQIEAVLISSGHALPTGLIAAEAAEREITPDAMAAIVLAKSAKFMAAELARQAPDIAAKKLAPGGTKI